MSGQGARLRFMTAERRGKIRLKIISCNVMQRELCHCVSRSPNRIDIEFLHQGLHEFPERLNRTVQDALDRVEAGSCDYILLNYGHCGNGIMNIGHPDLPVVIHNVPDCVPLLIGDRLKHEAYMKKRPGTFWFSPGWIDGFPLPGSPDYAEKYDEFYGISVTERQRDGIERVLMTNYTHLTYITWKVLGERVASRGREYTKKCVDSLNNRLGMGMSYDEVEGDPGLLQRFVDGAWESGDYLVLQPGERAKLDPVKCRLYAERD